uniref:Candidate secreted effector n=1 Tax=Meloidogyne incognita TaxID=6306 RepID=A0A914LK29_MELIC
MRETARIFINCEFNNNSKSSLISRIFLIIEARCNSISSLGSLSFLCCLSLTS